MEYKLPPIESMTTTSTAPKKMQLVYVAGPYRSKTEYGTWANIQTADFYGAELLKLGYFPVIPHKNTALYGGLVDDSFILEGCLEMMKRCDLIYMIPGWETSEGSRQELREATRLGIPELKVDL